MNLRTVFKFKDCELQFYEKRRFFCYFSHACQSLAPLVETKTKKKHSFKIIIGFFFTPPLFLATKVAISFVYCSPKNYQMHSKA
ncbi:hypothetical protein pdam_00023296 [Pocillopora damicornis]|uniref:Uncharacterized protein n=1 Tax=Pocillopora damicornis TaxID=46731 RepID=A0A3M6T752_POCDA|nr:hypothetical protein pdam_00023296 [Pocillopora damicornis]